MKQYYHVLTTTPDMIYKFYRPSSVLSHGEGSNPTVPTTLQSLDSNNDLKERFFSWADSSTDTIRFELENGAIDAQESVDGGILLLVTGHMYLGDSRKPFCHTFFLNSVAAENSTKRKYYVHNDVLRFLQESLPQVTEPKTTADATTEVVPELDEQVAPPAEPASVETAVDAVADSTTVEEPIVEGTKDETLGGETSTSAAEQNPDVVAPVDDLPKPEIPRDLPDGYMEGVEETKEDFNPEESVEGTPDVAAIPAISGEVPTVPKENSALVSVEPEVKAKPPPGSWASLVATGRGNGASSTIAKPAAPPAKKPAHSVAVKKEKNTSPEDHSSKKESKEGKKGHENATPKSSENNKPRGRRDPDCTLVIKNVQDGVKEADVRLVFEPFAVQTKSKIVGITVSQRGLAFVDYDSPAPVLAALEKKDTFTLNGKSVSVDQKTNDTKGKGRGGGGGGGGGNTFSIRPNGQRTGRSEGNAHRNNNASHGTNAAPRKDTVRKEGSGKGGQAGGGK